MSAGPSSSQVMYVALSSYEEREEEFKAEVVMMRQRFDPERMPRPSYLPLTACMLF